MGGGILIKQRTLPSPKLTIDYSSFFQSKENWSAKKNIKWDTFPSPKYIDINWDKKALIGILS